MVHVDLKSSFKVKVGEHQAPVAVAVGTWLAQQPQSEVDVVLLVRLPVRPVRVHVDHRLAAHVEQETCNKTTTNTRKYFLKMGNIFQRWEIFLGKLYYKVVRVALLLVTFVAAVCNVMMMISLNT